jgi:transcription antitermination factor NusG
MAKPGRKVRILRGPFAGIIGEIKNYKTHRVVVVKLTDLGLASALTKIPKKDLEFIETITD